ncbi:S8 family serine peptidase [Pseudobacteriovorax antillogorgiicola]|uniref:Subtilase family protein n=1 Tax=Pseudobacteriovorax antillogorgiicola TaxID=1513793 RepID=A0A1Y6CP79_9BACT|nr:S8 family serine peptidase [Pseudobacteriovorax antillogorgiicola]TCS46690.1 subtilase family protein [Pseudobacteriovorax antillogorgiicola]SMF66769.1 Subtilase family protein [Pseudobacteriovorax antillogorgiicola]
MKTSIIGCVAVFFLGSCGARELPYQIIKTGSSEKIVVQGQTVHQTNASIDSVRSFGLDGELVSLEWREQGQSYTANYGNQVWSVPRPKSTSLPLRFDLSLESSPTGLYLVQLQTPLVPSIRDWLQGHGARVLRVMGGHRLVLAGEQKLVDQLVGLSFVSWVKNFHSSWKVPVGGYASEEKVWLIQAAERSQMELLRAELVNRGIKVLSYSKAGFFHGLVESRSQLDELLESPLVIWAEPDSQNIELDMDNARIQGGANYLETNFAQDSAVPAYTGVGIKGHVLEGIDPSHPDFAASEFREKPIGVDNLTVSSHGHKTFGILFGSGLGNEKSRGLLPNGQGYYTHYTQLYLEEPGSRAQGGRYELTERLIEDHGVMFQTASWGYSTTLDYTLRSAEMDQIVFDLDIPIMQSQSNAGTRWSRPQAWAKNVISVGGVYHFETADPSDDQWDAGKFSRGSIGPAEDGRIKPDLVGYMDTTYTTNLGGGYIEFGGTSGATPMVAGHVGLLLEMAMRGDLNGIDRQDRLHSATAKALLIHGAAQYAFAGRDGDMNRFHQGWGFPDLRQIYRQRQDLTIINESVPLQMNDRFQQEFVIGPGDSVLATLVYRDPPGVIGSGLARVNDLDLRLTSPSGQVFWGNAGLKDSTQSQPDGAPDEIDTVERVIIDQAEEGVWTVEVLASEVNQDTYLGTPELDAGFALVLSRGVGNAAPY